MNLVELGGCHSYVWLCMLAWSAFGGEARAVLVSRLTGVAVLKWSLFDAMAVVASLLCLFEWLECRMQLTTNVIIVTLWWWGGDLPNH